MVNSATRESSADVLIVGGGLVGLTLAVALGGAGASVAVIERQRRETVTAARHDGRSSAIAAGSQRVLAALGLWRGLADAAGRINEIRVTDGASPLFLHYDHRDVGAGPLGYIVENTALRRVLSRAVAAVPSVRVHWQSQIAALDRAGATATARLDDGAIVHAPLVIAADGRDSPVREAAGIGVVAWRYPQVGIVCTVAHERPHRGIAQEHFLPAGPFAILPMTGDRSSIVWTEHADLAPALMALDETEFIAELGRRFGDHLGAIEVVGDRFSYPLSLVHAERYTAPRLALAGDAAHGIHPIAGQGLNMGLRDVAALAEVIIDARRLGLDPGAMSVLARYQRWRRFDNLAMIAATDALNRLFSNDVGPIRLARDLGLAAVNRAPPLKRLFMRHAMGLVGELPRLARGLPL